MKTANKRSVVSASTAVLFAATLIGVSLGACTVSVGDGTPIDFDAGGFDTARPPVSNPGNVACNSCLYQGCSGQHSLCQSNSECIAIYQCATAPGCDQNCVNNCFDAHPNGQREYTALYTCDQQTACASCSSQCNVASCAPTTFDAGPIDANGPVVETDSAVPMDCSGCTAARCTAEQSACAPNTDCDVYSSCVIACPDAACTNNCGVQHPQGKAASDALGNCTAQQCKTECGL